MYGYNIIFSKKLGIRHLIGYSLNYPIKYFSFGRSLSGRAIQGFRPHRSSTLQVRPSLAMLQDGSDSIVPPTLSSTLQVRSSLAMLQNGFGQPCSLTIPNAMKRLPALLPGHLSSAWCCQTERNTCRLSHGCTPFRCGIGLRRYGLRCRLALHRVPR